MAIEDMRAWRSAQLFIAVLRIAVGFAFLPAGLKKVLGQPFTDPGNVGRFHEFLHAFHDTGLLYRAVGVLQLVTALLLMTQRFALLGAFFALPILVAINLLCWTTAGVPTVVTVSLLLSSVLLFLLWDWPRWRSVLAPSPAWDAPPAAIVPRVWSWCGAAIYVGYLVACAIHGGVYRPRRLDWSAPGTYVLLAVAVAPFIAWWFDRALSRLERD